MKKRRVMFFICERDYGISTFLTQQTLAFNKIENIDFLFISGNSEKENGLFNQLDVENIPYRKVEGLEYHREFRRLVRIFTSLVNEFNPHILHVQNNWQLAIAIIVKLLSFRKFKIFYTVHGFRNNKNILIRELFRLFLGLVLFVTVDKVLFATTYVKDSFSILRDRLQKLLFGVDDIYFINAKKHRFIGNKIVAIYPAQFREGKDQDKLIRIIAKYNSLSPKKVELILPGDGDNLNKCIQLSKQLNVQDSVVFPGHLNITQLTRYYNDSHIAIIASKSETFGFCIVEPIIMNCLVLSKPVGIAKDIIESSKNGFIYNKIEELPQIFDILFESPNLYEKILSESTKLKHQFRWAQIAIEYDRIVT
ncbi:glycosyltransferase [Paludibacter sp.]|uniref:glycosyltransferase n=1 Tax=Paludibacter sp. TaxID=1898105 RepID=UPI001355BC53|nr:glycosyltransferase [Paludibacter sp.]MTK52798.1 glycosyltransferase [Paludibacter sp.]